MKRAVLVLPGILLATFPAGCRSARPQPPAMDAVQAATPARSSMPAECRACNGEWGKHGLGQKEGCLCRTKDAGKICKSKTECESECVAKDEPDTEIVDKGPPPKGYFLGRCHPFVTFFGCARLLQGLTAGEKPVPLDQLPSMICAD